MLFDMPRNTNMGERNRYIFTVGLMSYRPNYEGVDSFLMKIWPQVHSLYPALKYKVVGKGLPDRYAQKWLAIPGVQVLGFVDDIRSVYAKPPTF